MKKISNINLSSKKGISSLEKYAEEEAKKLFNRKKKEGYIEMPLDSNSKELIEDTIEEENEEKKIKEKENINKRQTREKWIRRKNNKIRKRKIWFKSKYIPNKKRI